MSLNDPTTLGEFLTQQWLDAPAERALKRYKIIICKNCHSSQMGSGKKMMKCQNPDCNRITRFFNQDGHLMDWILDTDKPGEASAWCRSLKALCFAVEKGGNALMIGDFFHQNKKKGCD